MNISIETWIGVKVDLLRPERWWSINEKNEARRNSGGGSKGFWRANRSSNLLIGAKDSSNHLVAGSLRSFSQDSWNTIKNELNQVKRMIRSTGIRMIFTYSQTLNGFYKTYYLFLFNLKNKYIINHVFLVGHFW